MMSKEQHSKEELHLARKLRAARHTGDYEKFLLGREIKQLREEAGMTQRDLADTLHTTQSVVARIESGKQNMTLETLTKIAGIFGKRVHFFFD